MHHVALPGIRVVVFDLDDTLYPERAFAFSGFSAVARWLRQQMDCPFDPAARMRELFDTGDRRRVFDQLLAELGSDQAEAWIPLMIQCYRSHRPAIGLHEDAEHALIRWQDRFRLALVSDGPVQMQQAKVDALGLASRLDPIIFTDQWGPSFWKPHPRAFREIESTLRATGPQCVYIADNAQKDFVAPRALGWRTIRVRRPDGIYANSDAPPDGEPEAEVTCLASVELSP